MKIRVRFNHWLPKKFNKTAITLYPFILSSDTKDNTYNSHIFHHEWIHIEQIRKIGVLKFYASYLLEFAKNFLRLRDKEKAYLAISYEAEAYANQVKHILSMEAWEAFKAGK